MLQPRPLASSQFPGSDFWVKYPFGGLVLKVPSWVFGGPTPQLLHHPPFSSNQDTPFVDPCVNSTFPGYHLWYCFYHTALCTRADGAKQQWHSNAIQWNKEADLLFLHGFSKRNKRHIIQRSTGFAGLWYKSAKCFSQGQHSQGGGLPLGAVKYFFFKNWKAKKYNRTTTEVEWQHQHAFRQCTLRKTTVSENGPGILSLQFSFNGLTLCLPKRVWTKFTSAQFPCCNLCTISETRLSDKISEILRQIENETLGKHTHIMKGSWLTTIQE